MLTVYIGGQACVNLVNQVNCFWVQKVTLLDRASKVLDVRSTLPSIQVILSFQIILSDILSGYPIRLF
jgi:hypothetical protein